MNEALFYIFAFALCVFAVLSVTVRHVFHSAIWLTLALLSVAGVYFFLDAEFLGVTQILVYVGGIMTLFVFAIMLTSKIGDQTIRQVSRQFWSGLLAAALLLAIFFGIITADPWMRIRTNGLGVDLKTLGIALVTRYALALEFTSLLLLVALVGAIVIGKAKK